jgi:DNA-binding transcriptional LysR family regulator
MEGRDLYYFEVIAELGHLGKAAKTLFKSQPALSHCIDRLEDEIGAQLFERVGRRIKLTPIGEMLLGKAKVLRQSHEDIVRELQDYTYGNKGHITVGCSPSMGAYVVPSLVAELMLESPAITINLSVGASGELLDKLRARQLDLLFSPMSYLGEDITAIPFLKNDMIVAVRDKHPILTKLYTVHDLGAYDWIMTTDSRYSTQWLTEALLSCGCPSPRIRITINIVSAMKELIVATDSLCFLSRLHVIHSNKRQLRELKIPELVFRRICSVAYRKHDYLSPIASRLVRLAVKKSPSPP